MDLTENEKRDAIKLIQAGKPLPDRYRFLLFDDDREVELVWNGKSAEVCNVVLPFQVIEQVDEPRSEEVMKQRFPLFEAAGISLDSRGRQLKGWTNKLIWGDNKLILSSLKNGPLREEIEKEGGIKLIYIDPPFDVGADFSMDIEIGDDTFTKKPNILEELAYRDTWGKGTDSYISMIYERLVLMRDLLAEDGSLYVHCDWRVNSYIRLALDEVFGKNGFKVDIQWQRVSSRSGTKSIPIIHDSILCYSKSDKWIYNAVHEAYDESYIKSHYSQTDDRGRRFSLDNATASGNGPARIFFGKEIPPPAGTHWKWTQENIDKLIDEGKIVLTSSGKPRYKRYLDEMPGRVVQSIWTDIPPVNSQAVESLGYPTQKPVPLIERILNTSSNEGDIVADFFVGSGTTAGVAEKLGRKWIVSDLGKFAIHTTRKRMIGVQRELKNEDKDWRAFEILNLGKYERQHYIGVNASLREEEKQKQLEAKEKHFLELILHAYRAEPVENFKTFHGKKAGRMVTVGPVNLPVTRLFVEEVILECREKRVSRVDILGFEFEMGLFPNILDEAKEKGIDLAMKYIPADVFDKRAVERNQVVFHDVSYIEVKPHVKYPPDKGGKGGYIPYNTELTEKARENRKNPTAAEKKMWYEVMSSQKLSSLKFTRQKPLGEYIVDFYCAELMLAIEIDGDTHSEQQEYDNKRTMDLNRLGVEVVRYTNRDVMDNIEGVYEDLQRQVQSRKPPKSPLSGGLQETTSGGLQETASGGLYETPGGVYAMSKELYGIAVELTDFSVFYSQDSIDNAAESLKDGSNKIVVEQGQIVKVSKDKKGIVTREVLTQNWTDWIDYWSVDFDFEQKREIISVRNEATGEVEEYWTGDFVFENEWQSFRTNKDRSLELKTPFHACDPGRYKIAVKVVDIFGNDTMKIVEVNVY